MNDDQLGGILNKVNNNLPGRSLVASIEANIILNGGNSLREKRVGVNYEMFPCSDSKKEGGGSLQASGSE